MSRRAAEEEYDFRSGRQSLDERTLRLKSELLSLSQNILSHYEVQQAQTKMLSLLNSAGGAAMSRFHPHAHFTASAFICTSQGELLALFHRKLQRWLQPGGHMEAVDLTPFESALREAREESGLEELHTLSTLPIDLDIHLIPARAQEPQHAHYDLRYAFLALHPEKARISEESTGLRWLSDGELSEWRASSPSIERPVGATLNLLKSYLSSHF